MGLFSKPKYVGYNFAVRNYNDALDFQDYVVREANFAYNLDLREPIRVRGEGYINLEYDCNSRKEAQVVVYVTDLTVLIGFEETYLSEDKVMAVADKAIQDFANNGITIQYDSTTKPVKGVDLYRYMLATAGLY